MLPRLVGQGAGSESRRCREQIRSQRYSAPCPARATRPFSRPSGFGPNSHRDHERFFLTPHGDAAREGPIMAVTDLEALIGPQLAGAIAKKGYAALTAVQQAVLDPSLAGRDLRISSQTGSGKTVAIGLTLREILSQESASSAKGAARPRALVVTPTRELATQVQGELSWLYAPLKVGVASVIGGGNFRDERRALGSGPGILVGTPGRLLDHLTRGSVDGSNLGAVVLDEADRMLDLGFRDDLEAILGFAPKEHRTHLVSATFPREVMALANRVQNDPARIEGTPMGAANADIEHLVHVVLPHERLDAIVNLLLETPGATTLIFARTRADVGELTRLLGEAGFEVDALSGEMEQRERNKALAAFKRGSLDALVATDVAARGLDVEDVARVLHAEPPMDPDSYTHRSGRTGRAGRKGKSSVLVTPPALNRVSSLLKRAGVRWRIDAVPTAATIEAAREDRLIAGLTAHVAVVAPEDASETPPGAATGPTEADDRSWALAKRIVEMGEGTRALARMIGRSRASGPEARAITVLNAQAPRKKPWEERAPNEGRAFAEPRSFNEPRGLRPERAHSEHGGDERGARREPGPARTARDAATDAGSWVSFRISWGQIHGADARRLLAMVCRRGGVRGSDVGAIKVSRTFSTVDVSAAAAAAFEQVTREPDPRDPRVKIRPASDPDFDSGDGGRRGPVPADRPSRAKATIELDRPSRSGRSVPNSPVDRPSKTADRPSRAVVPADRPSRATDRSSKTLDRPSVPADRPSTRSARDTPSKTDRQDTMSSRSLMIERPSRRTLVVDRPSKPVRDSEVALASKSDRSARSEPSDDAVHLAKESRAVTAERPELTDRPSRSAFTDRRPRPPVPERYGSRQPPKTFTREPRDSNKRPAYDPPRREPEGSRSHQERPAPQHGGPRPPHFDRSRPRQDGPRPGYDAPRPPGGSRSPGDESRSSGGPPSHAGGGSRPPHTGGGSRPPSAGQRPGGPRPSPASPYGNARPTRKKP